MAVIRFNCNEHGPQEVDETRIVLISGSEDCRYAVECPIGHIIESPIKKYVADLLMSVNVQLVPPDAVFTQLTSDNLTVKAFNHFIRAGGITDKAISDWISD